MLIFPKSSNLQAILISPFPLKVRLYITKDFSQLTEFQVATAHKWALEIQDGDIVFKKSGEGNFSEKGDGTLTTANPKIKCESTYGAAFPYTELYSVSIYYR